MIEKLKAAYELGAKGAEPTDAERLLFEEWMRGHCWALSAMWDGKTYRGTAEDVNYVCPRAMNIRQLWAAWRDRAALTEQHVAALEAEVERLTRAWQAMQLAKSKAEASEKEVWNEREALRGQLAAAQGQEPVMHVILDNVKTPLYAAPIPQQTSVPEGWKLVPIEPTDMMMNCFSGTLLRQLSPPKMTSELKAYEAMLAAAPQPKETK